MSQINENARLERELVKPNTKIEEKAKPMHQKIDIKLESTQNIKKGRDKESGYLVFHEMLTLCL